MDPVRGTVWYEAKAISTYDIGGLGDQFGTGQTIAASHGAADEVYVLDPVSPAVERWFATNGICSINGYEQMNVFETSVAHHPRRSRAAGSRVNLLGRVSMLT